MDQADIIKRIAEAMSASMNAAKIVETNNERFGGPQKAGKKFVEYTGDIQIAVTISAKNIPK